MKNRHLIAFLAVLSCLAIAGTGPGAWAASESIPVGEPRPGIGGTTDGSKLDFKLNGSAGASGITNLETGRTELFNTVSFQPEVALGKLGLGLDLYLNFDSAGRIRKQDWDRGDDYISKIWYARWGLKGDPLYARVGGLTDATLGHGLIMGRYSNRLSYPDTRKVGAELSVDGGWAGAEGMLSDLRRADVFGGRFFVRPLRSSEAPLIKNMALGVTGVTDQNPDEDKGTTGDEVSVYGADVEVPLASMDIFSAKLYGDAAVMKLGRRYRAAGAKDNGRGFAGGVAGSLVKFVTYKAELRSLDNNFVPTYFNSYYDVDRSTNGVNKADAISRESRPVRRGPMAELGADILGKLRVGATYEDYNLDLMNEYPRIRAEARLDPSVLLGKVDAAAYYDRRNVNTFRQFGRSRSTDAIMAAEAGVWPTQHLKVTIVVRQQYAEDGRPVRTTQVRTDLRF